MSSLDGFGDRSFEFRALLEKLPKKPERNVHEVFIMWNI